MRAAIHAVFVGLALAAAFPAAATVLVDTGVPSVTNGGYVLGPEQFLAAKFASPATTLTDLRGFIGGSFGTLRVALYSDGGTVPGTELYATEVAATTLAPGWLGATGVAWRVAAGNYFIAFEVDQGDDETGRFTGYMPYPAPHPLAVEAIAGGSVYDYHPATLGIGVRIDAAGAVPEPSDWWLMIAGFGLIGAAVRRRRSSPATDHISRAASTSRIGTPSRMG